MAVSRFFFVFLIVYERRHVLVVHDMIWKSVPGREGNVHIAVEKDDGSQGEKQRLTIHPAILQSLSSAIPIRQSYVWSQVYKYRISNFFFLSSDDFSTLVNSDVSLCLISDQSSVQHIRTSSTT